MCESLTLFATSTHDIPNILINHSFPYNDQHNPYASVDTFHNTLYNVKAICQIWKNVILI